MSRKIVGIPDPVGAVNNTTPFDIGLFAASFTVTPNAVPKAVPTVADCGVVFIFAAICVGTCTTGTFVSLPLTAEPELVWTKSPPPKATAVFVTKVGEFPGTLTMILMARKELPPAICCVDVQLAVCVV